MRKQSVIIFICFVFIISIFPVSAFAVEVIDSGKCGRNLTWTLEKNGVFTISGSGKMYDYDIESTPWYEIGFQCQKIVIEKNVSGIDDEAFLGFYNQETFAVNKNNQYFSTDKNGVLYNKDKTELLKVPAQFAGEYVISDGVERVNAFSFAECQVSQVTVSESVKNIEENTFYCCDYIDVFIADDNNTSFSSENGILYNKDKTELICVPRNIEEIIIIPASVKSIYASAFSDGFEVYSIKFTGDLPKGFLYNEWTSIVAYYPEGNLTWTEDAMENLGPDVVYFPYDASDPNAIFDARRGTIGDDLEWVLNDDGLLTISGVGQIYLEDGEYQARWIDYADLIKTIVIEEGVTNIPRYIFNYCYDLTDISIPSTVVNIDSSAFECCESLKNVVISEDNPYYISDENGLIYNKNKTEIVWVPFITESSYTFTDNITSVGPHAMTGGYNLRTINIPAGLTDIDSYAFCFCYYTLRYVVAEDNPNYSSDEFGVLYNKDKSELIQIPDAFTGNYTIPASVIKLSEHSFANSSYHISNLKFEGDAPSFEGEVFYGMEVIAYYPENNETWTQDVRQQYGGNVKWIAYDPADFNFDISSGYSDSLTWTITFDGELIISGEKEIGDFDASYNEGYYDNTADDPVWRAFNQEVKSIEVCEGITRIGEHAFGDLDFAISAVIPHSVTEIGANAFRHCGNLSDITIKSGVTRIGNSAFWECFSLETITIPTSVTEIGVLAFGECFELKEIKFTGDAPEFEDDAFLSVTATAYYPANDPTWTDAVRQDYGGDITWVSYDEPVKELYLHGDLNGDGNVTNIDLIILYREIHGYEKY